MGNNANTVIGALIAALILLGTGLLALFQQEEIASITDIPEATWWVLGLGALLSFGKDFQAIWSRKMINKVTNADKTPVAIIAMLAMSLLITGCAGMNPVSVAETQQQNAAAYYGVFVALEEAGASLVESPDISDDVKDRIREADARAKPVADSLFDAMLTVIDIQEELRVAREQAGQEETALLEAQLRVANSNLIRWVDDLLPHINALREATRR